MKSANQLTQEARETSRLAGLWLEHPYVAHQKHEQAASAHDKEGNAALAKEHRSSAQYWAKKEMEANSQKYDARKHN